MSILFICFCLFVFACEVGLVFLFLFFRTSILTLNIKEHGIWALGLALSSSFLTVTLGK